MVRQHHLEVGLPIAIHIAREQALAPKDLIVQLPARLWAGARAGASVSDGDGDRVGICCRRGLRLWYRNFADNRNSLLAA